MSLPQGLTPEEAARRLQQDGPNELSAARPRTVFHLLLEVIREPMFLLLLGAGAIYLALGDAGDALLLLGFVFFALAITIVQSRKTERVLETLRDLSSPRALVIRGGQRVRIPGREVVRGDCLVLEEGDRIAADGVLLECYDLQVDESLLTGESVPVEKSPPVEKPLPVGASMPSSPATGQAGEVTWAEPERGEAAAASHQRVFSGAMVVQGSGLARVTATGTATEIGKIGRALQELAPEPSPLQREIGLLVRRFALVGLVISLLVFVAYGATRHDWLKGLLTGITLAMSVLPEEFTVIFTVFMALGAWRISQSQVLTRHTPVIEALGSATVLCVDKTGTLTQNRMSLQTCVVAGHERVLADPAPLPPDVQALLRGAVLASEIAPFDPMEKALHDALAQHCPADADLFAGRTLRYEYPLTRDILAMTHVWESSEAESLEGASPEGALSEDAVAGQGAYTVASKGAPETMARLCGLSPQATATVMQQVQALAAQGMRVLGVAQTRSAGPPWPQTPQGFGLHWLGLVGLADPIRPAVAEAVRECRQAGIRVVMITGDYPATAEAIARQAGLADGQMMSGPQLAALDDTALAAVLADIRVFARILPEQKLRLVQAFKARGDVVAMTGDGVNDAPALKAAHIGISMGERGTDVAREASSLVLLNDDFTSIVRAIRLGRRIYDNLRKALSYVVAVHLPIAGMTLLPLLFGLPPAFAPVHIVFLEMIINPACAIVFEAEAAERDTMQRPPRQLAERLFGARHVGLSVLQGLGLLAVVAVVYFQALADGLQEGQASMLAFTTLVVGNLCLILSSRSLSLGALALLRTPNPAQWWMLGLGSAALLAVSTLPFLQQVFHFEPVAAAASAKAVGAGAMALLWFEAVKYGFRSRA